MNIIFIPCLKQKRANLCEVCVCPHDGWPRLCLRPHPASVSAPPRPHCDRSLSVWPCMFELPFKHQSTFKVVQNKQAGILLPLLTVAAGFFIFPLSLSLSVVPPPPLKRVQNILFSESVKLQARRE